MIAHLIHPRPVLVLLTAILALPGAAVSQERLSTDGQPPASAGRVPSAGGAESQAPARPPLLREGSHLVRVVGRLQPDPVRRSWNFIIDPADEHSPGHELAMMPGTLLAEMERMIESAPDHQLVFEMTGEVYIFRGRNYLMPTHPPLLIGREERPQPSPAEGQAVDESATATDESTEDIIRNLERSVGPVARRPEAETPARAEGEAPAAVAGAAQPDLLREGTVLLSRRGAIRRTGDGAFLFVFDADAEGLADPPMTLLPCLLLERMDPHIRQEEDNAAVLLSGHVYTYHGRNYLLPKVYRIPAERTVLKP